MNWFSKTLGMVAENDRQGVMWTLSLSVCRNIDASTGSASQTLHKEF